MAIGISIMYSVYWLGKKATMGTPSEDFWGAMFFFGGLCFGGYITLMGLGAL